MNGHTKVVALLLSHGTVDVNWTDKRGATALFYAAMFGHTAIVRLLVARERTNVNCSYTYGQTPLFMASMKGHSGVVEVLLSMRADVDVNQPHRMDGATPLFKVPCPRSPRPSATVA